MLMGCLVVRKQIDEAMKARTNAQGIVTYPYRRPVCMLDSEAEGGAIERVVELLCSRAAGSSRVASQLSSFVSWFPRQQQTNTSLACTQATHKIIFTTVIHVDLLC
jgi:hypothetical protein